MASACSIVLANEQMSIIGGGAGSSASLKTRASTCLLMTVAVVCVCVLVVCGVFVVREYSLARTYAPTTCRLGNITYSADVWCLYCSGTKDKTKEKGTAGGACVNTASPCVHINVVYQLNETLRRALLYQDSVQAIGVFSQCSYSVCMKSREDSLRSIEGYVDVWRSKSSLDFQCFYDTESPDKAIAHKTYTQLDVVHSMLWPSVVIVACGAIFLRIEANRRGLTFCGTRPKDTILLKDKANWPPSTMQSSAASSCSPRQGRRPDNTAGKQRSKTAEALQKRVVGGDSVPPPPPRGGREPALRYVRRLSTSMTSLEKVRPRDRCFVHMTTAPLLINHAAAGCHDDDGGGGSVRRKSTSVEKLKDIVSISSDSQAAAAAAANRMAKML